MSFLAHYLYISPDGTYTDKVITESRVFVSENLNDVIAFLEDNFDGLETFQEKFIPLITNHFESTDSDYFGDDWSAGQWFRISKFESRVESVI
jgi:hypothetical protein